MINIDLLRGFSKIHFVSKDQDYVQQLEHLVKDKPKVIIKIYENVSDLKDLDDLSIILIKYDDGTNDEKIKEDLEFLKNNFPKNASLILIPEELSSKDKSHLFNLGIVQIHRNTIAASDMLNNLGLVLENQKLKYIDSEKRKLNDQLLHMLSHELINPISSGQSLYEMIKSDPTNIKDFSQYVEESFTSALNLIEVSRMLLSVERESDNSDFDYFKLTDLINEALNMFKGDNDFIKSKEINIINKIDSDFQVYCSWSSLIKYILFPIIHNAIKFSTKGADVLFESFILEDGLVNLKITDYGVGIPEKMIEEIIDVSKATTRKGTEGEEGLGYSMALASRFIRKFGGDMEYISEGNQTSVSMYFKGQRGS